MFDAVAFAGGGNRCYWQGGFWEAAATELKLEPHLLVGASGGAWAASYNSLRKAPEVIEKVVRECSLGRKDFEWEEWKRNGSFWPVSALFNRLLDETIDEQGFRDLQNGPEILAATSLKPQFLPLSAAVAVGLAAYEIEKALFRPTHPNWGRALGFRSRFFSSKSTPDRQAWITAILGSCCVPPITPPVRFDGLSLLDGGLVDNVPVEPLAPIEADGGRTLVLLTRRYERLPDIPGRLYVEPSQKIEVHQFAITSPHLIRAAYDLGLKDGKAFAMRMRNGQSSKSA